MSDQRQGGIAWTDQTWNPIRGCSRVSEGCRHCYAERVARRFSGAGQPYEGLTHPSGRWNGTIRVVDEHLLDPLRWRRPRRVFVNSMSDLFHENVSDETIDRIFAVMALAPRHTFQVLTKRPERMRSYLAPDADAFERVSELAMSHQYAGNFADEIEFDARDAHENMSAFWPLPNVWLGVSVEDQATADARIPLLLQTPAAVRFVSAEPLLGPVTLNQWLLSEHGRRHIGAQPGLSWVIVGGESGPGARPFDVSWARTLIAQCKGAGVACFVKQLGSRPTSIARPFSVTDDERRLWMLDGWTSVITSDGELFTKHPRLTDRKGADPAEWDEYLRVQEFPQAVRA